jgi:peptidoglycan-N-acetylglucosamine deacetylase
MRRGNGTGSTDVTAWPEWSPARIYAGGTEIIPAVVRHALAPVVPAAAHALGLPRVLSGVSGVALTFDDGPHPDGTPAVLEVLAREGARATFFMIGEQVERRPALAAEVLAAGHAIALHGYRHRLQLRLSSHDVHADLRRGAAAIEDATGASPVWHRPPFGIYSAAGLAFTRDAGLRPLLWSRWGKDWRKFTTPGRIAARATANVADGDVILLHDADFYSSHNSYRRTVEAVGSILSALKSRQIGTVLLI